MRPVWIVTSFEPNKPGGGFIPHFELCESYEAAIEHIKMVHAKLPSWIVFMRTGQAIERTD